jgi:hypothetical protein
MSISPYVRDSRAAFSAVYAQEQWTHGRWTLQGAVRYDNAWSYTPDLVVGPVKWIPTPVSFPAQDLVSWKDVTPKMGLAWDVTGNGKTAVRVNLGKYVDPARAGGTYSAQSSLSHLDLRHPHLDRRQP